LHQAADNGNHRIELKLLSIALMFAALFWAPLSARADAVIVNASMFANTIAEYFVEQDHVRIELEIGEGDIAVFRNLLPDALYAGMGFGDAPLEDRLRTFLTEDMPVFADGEPLTAFIQDMSPDTRPLRDAITGEVLPTPEDQAVPVIRATVVFPLQTRPETLTLYAPSATGQGNIGFVLYHKGVAVNDYRYLGSGYTVHLDWDDPWYSAFPQRSLQRQYSSPMAGFIYVEPYEVRKEIIVRPYDIQQYMDLGLEGRDVIPADMQDGIKQKIVEFLDGHFPLRIDGEPVEMTIDRVNFLRRTLRNSTVVEQQDIDVLPATLGIIYVTPTSGLPQTVEMDWDLFSKKMPKVSAATVDEAGALPIILEPDYAVLKWENYLKSPTLPTLAEIAPPPTALQKTAVIGRWAAAGLALVLLALAIRGRQTGGHVSKPMFFSAALFAALALLLIKPAMQAEIGQERLKQLSRDLLHNVYRAFDYRGEEVIYDVLAQSVGGDLLTDVYLETRRGLELVNQGGARVKVNDVEVQEAVLKSRDGGTLQVESRWSVGGSVGHWGHIHQRRNGYHALLEISDIGGRWKLTGLEILQEERL